MSTEHTQILWQRVAWLISCYDRRNSKIVHNSTFTNCNLEHCLPEMGERKAQHMKVGKHEPRDALC